MSEYLEVVQFRKQGEKWNAQRLGAAKKNDKGQLNVWLNALPIPDHEGQVKLVIQPRQEQQNAGSVPQQGSGRHPDPARQAPPDYPDLNDDLPF